MNTVLLKSAKIPVLGVPLNPDDISKGALRIMNKRKPKVTV